MCMTFLLSLSFTNECSDLFIPTSTICLLSHHASDLRVVKEGEALSEFQVIKLSCQTPLKSNSDGSFCRYH